MKRIGKEKNWEEMDNVLGESKVEKVTMKSAHYLTYYGGSLPLRADYTPPRKKKRRGKFR